MGIFDALLQRLGLVRLRRFNLVISADGRLVPAPEVATDSWFEPVPSAHPIPALAPQPVPPPMPRAARGTEPVPRAPSADLDRDVNDDEDWELKLADARRRAEAGLVAETAPAAGPPQPEVTDEEWEWKLAMAKARARERHA